jgi:hypothetical protein
VRAVALALAAIAVLGAAGAAADAGAAMRVVDVPGVGGRDVTITAAGRLGDGGAIVVGTLTPRKPRRARPRIVVVRLRHDGLSDAAFGDAGVVTVQLARGDGRAGSRAVAVAVDPVRGRSWIGAAIGGNDAGAILALDGRGRRLRRFGSGSVVRLHGDATAPTAIAFGNGRLAVAATRRPCRGCQVLLLDPDSGARGAQVALAPVAGGDARRCPAAQLGSLALAGANRLVLGGSGGASCPTRLVVRDGGLRPTADWGLGQAAGAATDAAVRTAVASAGAPLDLCAGVQRDGAVSVVRLATQPPGTPPMELAPPGWSPVAGTLVAVVPLGGRACGALLRRAGQPARVVQASNGDARPAVADVPAGLHAGAIYRCKRHVLIVGTRRAGGADRAAVAVTAIVRR